MTTSVKFLFLGEPEMQVLNHFHDLQRWRRFYDVAISLEV